MATTYLNYPFDAEVFDYNWKQEEDPVLTAMFQSGAVVENAEIANLIANGSDIYTIPFYQVIGGDPANYDGATNVAVSEPTSSAQSGVVYGRTKGWTARDFVIDFHSDADPMQQITSQVAKYWLKYRQSRMVDIVEAVFGVTGSGDFADWANHKASGAAITATSANSIMQAALGDNKGKFALAIMHSAIATVLENENLLSFRKYTDPMGIERQLNIADYNGLTVVVDDGVYKTTGDTPTYATYFLGQGALQYAAAPVKVPSEVQRDAITHGGEDTLVTRIRETIHPNGFSFTRPSSGYTYSPTDAQLLATANWSIVGNPKNIAMARLITPATSG